MYINKQEPRDNRYIIYAERANLSAISIICMGREVEIAVLLQPSNSWQQEGGGGEWLSFGSPG